MYSHNQTTVWLLESPLAPYIDAFTEHFTQECYSPITIKNYHYCLAHFAHWLDQCDFDVLHINEEVTQQFLDEYSSNSIGVRKVHSSHKDMHAALVHLLIVLRANAVIPFPSVKTTAVDKELQYFDDYMNHVRGLKPKTRRHYICIIRRLLVEQFSDNAVLMSAIQPEDVRQFITRQKKLYSTPGSAGLLISALRGYFRFRTTCGDQVNHLIGVACFPANWQLSSLPKALSSTEVECLLKVLNHDSSLPLRTKAIVHCALDLGLRSCEIANLGLDDIDWYSATITLKKTKSRCVDIMPLPEATGLALANYLKYERPQTTKNRAVFVRNIAPREQPIGPDLIRKAIRQAYALAGLPYTRSHLLRHTMASRLLESGSSLKEVADILRHRSINTTLIYAKLDSKNLVSVALPWPGSIL
jgi:site-specific recombinase XerD